MTAKLRVGLIGVGLMGHGIGKNILKKGFPLVVLAHRNRAPVENLIGAGAQEGRSPKELAECCDLVLICVTGSPQVEDAVYRTDGLLEGMRSGLIVADCTTALPASTRKIAAAIAARGGHFLDTPMTRTPKEAEEGRLALMTGGDQDVLGRIRPVLECFTDTILHVGAVGAAHTMKLINNFMALGTAAVVAEALGAAIKAGVDMKSLHDVIVSGGANSVMFGRLIKVPLEGDDTALKFYIENAVKDLRYYNTLAEDLNATALMASTAVQSFLLAEHLGHGQSYVTRMVDVMAKLNRSNPG